MDRHFEIYLLGRVIVAAAAAILVFRVWMALRTGKVRRDPFHRTYTREHEPFIYWVLTTFLAIFAAIILTVAIIVLFTGFFEPR